MSYQQDPDSFYRKFSNDSFYRDLIFALKGFAIVCLLWAAVGFIGSFRSRDWQPALATYQQHPYYTSSNWQILCIEKDSQLIPITRLYFGGNPPHLGLHTKPIPTPVTVYIDPNNPKNNVVYRHPSWMTWFLSTVGILFLSLIRPLKSLIAI
jgi:hypothetical protein